MIVDEDGPAYHFLAHVEKTQKKISQVGLTSEAKQRVYDGAIATFLMTMKDIEGLDWIVFDRFPRIMKEEDFADRAIVSASLNRLAGFIGSESSDRDFSEQVLEFLIEPEIEAARVQALAAARNAIGEPLQQGDRMQMRTRYSDPYASPISDEPFPLIHRIQADVSAAVLVGMVYDDRFYDLTQSVAASLHICLGDMTDTAETREALRSVKTVEYKDLVRWTIDDLLGRLPEVPTGRPIAESLKENDGMDARGLEAFQAMRRAYLTSLAKQEL